MKKKQSPEDQAKSDLAEVLLNRSGRRFIMTLLGPSESTGFDQNPYMFYYNQGMRDRSIALLKTLKTDHLESYLLMLRESNQDDTEREFEPQDPTLQDFP